jgi:GH25 family lysozyme M1 (1,4-beta-N-acetylmuramidase)
MECNRRYSISLATLVVWNAWNFWQYSQIGRVSVVNGEVDLERFNGSAEQI